MKKIAVLFVLLFLSTGWGNVMAEETLPKKVLIYDYAKKEFVLVEKVVKTDAKWKEELTPEEFKITRKQGTERAFSGKYDKHDKKGVYTCGNCGADLYASDTKFDSRTGWPSYFQPVAEENIEYKDDVSFFSHRVEVLCKRCGAHLGHVFNDGPQPTGKRHCINSLALGFKKA